MGESVLEQFGFKHFSYKSPSAVNCIVVASSPAGCCEFVGDLVFSGAEGRYCFNKTFCPKRIFADPKIYVSCPTRSEKLKAQAEQF